MKWTLPLLAASLLAAGCNTSETGEEKPQANDAVMSSALISQMQWMNQPVEFSIEDGVLSVTVGRETDFFNNPEDGSVVATAPFLYQNVSSDFVARALVQPDFSSQWNAVALFMHIDAKNWIKFGFENSDATGPSIVSVVTQETSDDANGVILNDNEKIWLAMVRKNDNYSMHWSADGVTYKMVRLTAMPKMQEVKIGLEIQSPVGEQATHRIHSFEIERRTVENMRDLNAK